MVRMWRGAGAVAAGAALGSQAALAWGAGGAALSLGAVQALASGWLLRGALPPRRRGWAGVAALVLLAALGLGAQHSARSGLLALAGASHAVLYAGLLLLFGTTLRRGQLPLVTRLARRLNPGFHAGMEGYTRGVTLAWCAFFAGQLAGSILLLAAAPSWWGAFVGLPGVALVAAMAVAERTVRGLRFPGMAHTSMAAVIRGVRAGAALPAAGADAARLAAGCPGHIGSATPRPAPAEDSAPEQAA